MKNKKGFTLIELLAVIVILAIIALIATPIVMNVIKNSRKGAAERGAENHLDAIETAIMEKRIDGEILSDRTYDLASLEAEIGTLEVSGQKATAASIIVKDGQVLDGSTLTVNGYVVNIVDGAGKVGDFGTVLDLFDTEAETVNDYIKGQSISAPTVTYNPTTGAKGCTVDNINCFGWYVLEDKGSEYAHVSLIMDKNMDDTTVAWCGDETLCKVDESWSNSAGPITVMNYLKSKTNNWKVAASLPTGQQIATAGGDESWNVSTPTGTELSSYLYNGLNDYSGIYGYWTSTFYQGESNGAWYVQFNGFLDINNVQIDSFGVRPVITVAKADL